MSALSFSFKDELEYIKHYRFKSIFFTYFRHLFIIMVIPVFIISFLIAVYYTHTNKVALTENITENFNTAATYAENMFDEFDKYNYLFESNQNVYEYAVSSFEDAIETTILAKNIYQTLVEYTSFGYNIKNIHIYFPYNGYVLSNKESNYLVNYSEKHLFENIPEDSYHTFFTSGSNNILHCSHILKKNDYDIAVIVYDIDLSFLLSVISDDSTMVILNANEEIIYSTPNLTVGDISEILSEINGSKTPFPINNSYYIKSSLCNDRYSIICSYPNTFTTETRSFIILLYICVALLTILLPLFIAFYISVRLYKSVAELISELELFETVSLSSYENEFNFLNISIHKMKEKNMMTESELILKAHQLKEANLRSLQLQINPHFIFNTLNLVTVSIMHELRKNSKSEMIISHLSTLIAATLDTQNIIIPFAEELDYINVFIEIEKIRFKNNFTIVYDVEPEVYERNIIKFTLQPIIENAFEYAIKTRSDSKGKITIKAYTDGSDTIIKITDNGKGIPKEKLENLTKSFVEGNEPVSHHHIGLYNVNQRISLLCGEEYGLTIESSSLGTTVTVKYNI